MNQVFFPRSPKKIEQCFQDVGLIDYPLVNIQKAIEAMAIEIVDLPIEHGGSFHSYVNVYQRLDVSQHNMGGSPH